MLAVGRLKAKREAGLEVRISWKGKSEGWVGGEWGCWFSGWDGMVTEVSRVCDEKTGDLEHLGRICDVLCIVVVCVRMG
jgi:hypothetical protein